MSKLPTNIRVPTARRTTQDEWMIDTILDLEIILKEVEAREISDSVKIPSAQAVVAQEFLGKSIVCVYCDQITNVNAWKEVLKCNRRCFVCFGKNHCSKNFDPNVKCRRCGGGHHQSICESFMLLIVSLKVINSVF